MWMEERADMRYMRDRDFGQLYQKGKLRCKNYREYPSVSDVDIFLETGLCWSSHVFEWKLERD